MNSRPESLMPAKKNSPVHTAFPLQQLVSYPLVLSLALAVSTVVLFSPVRNFAFVNLDDPAYVSANPHVQGGLSAQNIAWAFRTGHAGFWHPVTWLSLMVDTQFFGAGPQGFHLVNLLIHVTNVVLLFLLLNRVTGASARAALVAVLFAWHPLRVESVAWVAERKDVLSGLFFFLTLWAYVKYVEGHGKVKFYCLALALFVLGLMSKPMLVTLPCILLLLDYWPLNRLASVRRLAGLWPCVREKLPFFAASAAFSVVTFWMQRAAGAIQTLSDCPLPMRIENSVISYVRYLAKMFWPFELATPYPDPQLWPPLLFGVAAAALLLITVLLLWCKKQPYLAVGWLWFCGMLVPTIGLVQAGAQSMADRFTYLPAIGLFISLIWFSGAWCNRRSVPVLARSALVIVVLGACWMRTRDQLRYWQNSETLLSHTIATTRRNWIAEYNLGWELDRQGRGEEAMPHYQRVLALKPFDADTLNSVGCYLVRKKQFADAVPYFQAALKIKPGWNALRYNLAHCLFQQKKLDEAIPQFETFLKTEPNHIQALHELGIALALSGKPEPAIAIFHRVLSLQPDDAQAHFNLGEALALQGKTSEAKVQLSEALRLKPDWVEARDQLHSLETNSPQ